MNDVYLYEDGGRIKACKATDPATSLRCTLPSGHPERHCHQSFALTKPKDLFVAIAGEIRW